MTEYKTELAKRIVRKTTEALVKYNLSIEKTTSKELYIALGEAVLSEIAEKWQTCSENKSKKRRAYYFSAEYLTGRVVFNNLNSLGILNEVKAELNNKGLDINSLEDIEDAALGNGGLGRLAACFLDSAATHRIPLDGYGLRYKYGLFKQSFKEGFQVEESDNWQRFGDPFSVKRDDLSVIVSFAGQSVKAVPYDTPIIGYDCNGNNYIGSLRLFECQPLHEFDFADFNDRKYSQAVSEKNNAEMITYVLYPNDNSYEGKVLRLKQQYFLAAAGIADIVRSFFDSHKGESINRLSDYVAAQLNDTHPTVAIPELIRVLLQKGISFDEAFKIASSVFSYTNHTLMSEALEKWNVDLFKNVIPEIYEIICRINAKLNDNLTELSIDYERRMRMQIVKDNTIHMANLASFVSENINGVAKIHTEILKSSVLSDWYSLYPGKFRNKTNGITQRRFLSLCNPELTDFIAEKIGTRLFITDLSVISKLSEHINDDTIAEFNRIKLIKKRQLSEYIEKNEGIFLPTEFIFDIQAKRLHEYKRQLMNAFSVLDLYYGIKDGVISDFTPTAFIFGAKAAPGYIRAKGIIKYINDVARLINSDKSVSERLRVVFVKNYNCTYAEKIIPAADLHEQISPAGTEASGTGNMKFMLNGAVTLGTFDGANIEIAEQAGLENCYIFGARVDELNRIKQSYNPKELYNSDMRLKRVIDSLTDGTFSGYGNSEGIYRDIYNSLLFGADWQRADSFFILKDYNDYIETKKRAISDYNDRLAFGRKCLINTCASGAFSSDRTLIEYAKEIWHVK